MSETSHSPLSVFVINGDSGAGLTLIRALVKQGARVTASTAHGTKGAVAIRAVGGIPVYPELERAESLRSLMSAVKATQVVNLAALPLTALPHTAPAYAKHLNLLSVVTPAVVQAAEQAGVQRLVSLSLTSVYGDSDGALVDENSAPHASDALSKAALRAEKALLAASIPAYVLRVGYVYGNDSAFADLAANVVKGRGLPSGAGYAGYLYEDDLAHAVLSVIKLSAERDNRVYNIVADESVTSADFAATLGAALGIGAPAKRGFQLIPDELAEGLLAQSHKVSNSRAKVELDWTPSYSPAQGIERILMLQRAASVPDAPTPSAQKDLTLA